jgi:hypothetical protein
LIFKWFLQTLKIQINSPKTRLWKEKEKSVEDMVSLTLGSHI